MSKTEDKDLLYVFTDLETTGSDETTENILEVGIVITDANLEEIDAQSWVLFDDGDKLSTAADVVQEMHQANGLAALLPFGQPQIEVEAEWISELRRFGKKHDFVLAGSGVSHFDRRFIAHHMPRLLKWFRYYNIDVGVLRRSMRLIGREDLLMPFSQERKPHRALEDARLHLEEIRFIKKALS
jgi:oligoribonuclease